MSDQWTSWLRTVVPGLWSAVVAWLVTLGLPAGFAAHLDGLAGTVIVPVVLAVVYALLRRVEPWLPVWLTRILLGSNRPPTYEADGLVVEEFPLGGGIPADSDG